MMEIYEVDTYIFGTLECVRCGRHLPACTTYFKMDRQKTIGIKGTCRDCTAGYDYGRQRSESSKAKDRERYQRSKR